jgi:hypothetical protein
VSWDAFQRQVLAELGHALYLPHAVAEPPRVQPATALSVQPVTAGEHPMLARIARAAGVPVPRLQLLAPDLAAQADSMDAAAKRALWPRLRALRRDAR